MESSHVNMLIVYLEAHPLVAVGLVILGVLILGSLIRRLVRLAMILGLILLAALYWTHREAEADWRTQARSLKRAAEELGQDALDKGKELLEEGKKGLQKQLEQRGRD